MLFEKILSVVLVEILWRFDNFIKSLLWKVNFEMIV